MARLFDPPPPQPHKLSNDYEDSASDSEDYDHSETSSQLAALDRYYPTDQLQQWHGGDPPDIDSVRLAGHYTRRRS